MLNTNQRRVQGRSSMSQQASSSPELTMTMQAQVSHYMLMSGIAKYEVTQHAHTRAMLPCPKHLLPAA